MPQLNPRQNESHSEWVILSYIHSSLGPAPPSASAMLCVLAADMAADHAMPCLA